MMLKLTDEERKYFPGTDINVINKAISKMGFYEIPIPIWESVGHKIYEQTGIAYPAVAPVYTLKTSVRSINTWRAYRLHHTFEETVRRYFPSTVISEIFVDTPVVRKTLYDVLCYDQKGPFRLQYTNDSYKNRIQTIVEYLPDAYTVLSDLDTMYNEVGWKRYSARNVYGYKLDAHHYSEFCREEASKNKQDSSSPLMTIDYLIRYMPELIIDTPLFNLRNVYQDMSGISKECKCTLGDVHIAIDTIRKRLSEGYGICM